MLRLVRRVALAVVLLCAAAPGTGAAARGPEPDASPPPRPARTRVPSGLRVPFVENAGQTDPRVALYAKTPSGTAFFTEAGVTWGILGSGRRYAVEYRFAGAREGVRPAGEDASPVAVHSLRGRPESHRAGLRSWRKLRYREVWPGIDVVWETGAGGIKSTYEVRPGADPSRIGIDVHGATDLRVDGEGRLVARTPLGDVVDDRPVAWQDGPEGRRAVDVAFALDANRAGFRVGAFDPSLPLVIDPTVVVWSVSFGGSDADFAGGVATDPSGAVYVVGRTPSDETTFPVRAGFDLTFNGGDGGGADDAFVAKIAPGGDALVWVTYLGGSGMDAANDVVVDPVTGDVYLCGFTGSSSDFPVVGGPGRPFGGGLVDPFVSKLVQDGTAIGYSGFLGGQSGTFAYDDVANAIDLDDSGRLFVLCTTTATEATLATAGSFDATHNGGSDVYVVVVAPGGATIEAAGFFGGSGNETGTDIALGPGGTIHLCGNTNSAALPVAVGPSLAFGGNLDGFVGKFTGAGALVWAGFWGGAAFDLALGIDVDDAGRTYVVGSTNSPASAGFPVVNAFDGTLNGLYDASYACIPPDGSRFLASGYVGGAGYDEAVGCNVVEFGVQKRFLGFCGTAAQGFPVPAGGDATRPGDDDYFFATLGFTDDSPGGVTYESCAFAGTPGRERAESCALGDGFAVVAGAAVTENTGLTSLCNGCDTAPGILVARVDGVGGGGAETPATGFLAPESVRIVRRLPTDQTLAVVGALDIGAAGVATDPITVRVGGRTIVLAPNDDLATPRSRVFDGSGSELRVRLSVFATPFATSRNTVQLQVIGDLTDLVGPGGTVQVEVVQNGVTAAATVSFPDPCAAPQKASCDPRRLRGVLVDPPVVPAALAVTLDRKGSARFRAQFLLGDVPGAATSAPDVTFGAGTNAEILLPGAAATRRGATWVYRTPAASGPGATVRLSASKRTMAVDARGLRFDGFAEGPGALDVAVSVGAIDRAFRPVMVRRGNRIQW